MSAFAFRVGNISHVQSAPGSANHLQLPQGGSARELPGSYNTLGHYGTVGHVPSAPDRLTYGHVRSGFGYGTHSQQAPARGYRRDVAPALSEGCLSAVDYTAGEAQVLQEIAAVYEVARNIEQSISHILQWQNQAASHLSKLSSRMDDRMEAFDDTVSSREERAVSFDTAVKVHPPHRLSRGRMRGWSKEWDGSAPTTGLSDAMEVMEPPNVGDCLTDGGGSSIVAPLLPPGWPSTLEMRRVGEALGDPGGPDGPGSPQGSRANAAAFTATSKSAENIWLEEDVSCWRRWHQAIVLNPNSWGQTYHSLVLLLVLISDVTVVPYVLAFEVSITGVLFVVQMFTICFWTLDIFVTLLTGVFEEGKVQKDPWVIFISYARSWLVPDVTLVICDWISIMVELLSGPDTANEMRIIRFVRMGRFLRIIGVLRVIKFLKMFEELLNRRISESWRMIMKLITMVFLLLWINHLISCMWFQLGLNAKSDTGARWIQDDSQLVTTDLLDRGLPYQYLVSFHWAVAQVTLGSNDIYGTNSVERGFSSVCLIFGLLFGSTLVSSLSAAMVQFEMLRNGRVQKMTMVRRFLRDNEVDLEVSYLVQRQIKERLGGHEKLSDKDVPALGLLSSSLLILLRQELFRPRIVSHPLFRLWASMDMQLMRRLCFHLEFAYLRSGDDMCAPGPARPCAYLLLSGSMQYLQEPDTSPVTHATSESVKANTWLCEAALWTVWSHVGTAVGSGPAGDSCRLLQVSLAAVNEVIRGRTALRDIIITYASQFHKRLLAAKPPKTRFPTDIFVPFTDYEDIVASMSAQLQEHIGRDALHQLETRFHWRPNSGAFQNLRREVNDGRSVVMVDGVGEVMRVVAVLALRIQDDEGHIFVQLGKYDSQIGKVSKTLLLPGGKQERGETSNEAAQRILETRLSGLKDAVEFEEATRQVEWKNSKDIGVRTKYLRTVCSAKLVGEVDLPSLGVDLDVHGNGSSRSSAGSLTLTNRQTNKVETVYVMHLDRSRQSIGLYAWVTQEEFARSCEGQGECRALHSLDKLDLATLGDFCNSVAVDDFTEVLDAKKNEQDGVYVSTSTVNPNEVYWQDNV